MRQLLWKTVWPSLKKLNIKLPYDSAILLLNIQPKELKRGHQIKTCAWMFIVTIITITKKWKWAKCPSTDKWINKIWYICIMDYYAAITRKEVYICCNINETWKHYAKGNNADTKWHIFYDSIYMKYPE